MNHRVSVTAHFLSWSWKSKMGPSNTSYLSNKASFHFHDYGRKSNVKGVYSLTMVSWSSCIQKPGHIESKLLRASEDDAAFRTHQRKKRPMAWKNDLENQKSKFVESASFSQSIAYRYLSFMTIQRPLPKLKTHALYKSSSNIHRWSLNSHIPYYHYFSLFLIVSHWFSLCLIMSHYF